MERFAGRVALVTGASVGIGAAIAERLVKHGMKVVGCSRNVETIKALSENLKDQKGSLEAIKCDVRNEDEILSMFEQIKRSHGGVDICINNAGLGKEAPLLTGKTEDWKNMFDVNVIALMICSREAIKSMRERGVDDGHVVHISSMSGHRHVGIDSGCYTATKSAVRAITDGHRTELRNLKSSIRVSSSTGGTGGGILFCVRIAAYFSPNSPGAGVYYASKNALKAIVEGHRVELNAAKSKIRVSSISPGLVETEFAVRMRGEDAGKKLYSKLKCLQADDIADAVEYVISAPPHVQVHDILMRPTEQVS